MDKKMNVTDLINVIKFHPYKEMHLHHTFAPRHKDFDGGNHDKLQYGMRNYHINTKGWSDIGQHVTLFPDGVFLTGRAFSKDPASIYDHNKGAFAVEMLGNFDEGEDVLEGKQLTSILTLMKYFIDADKYIRFHRENSAKTCPGSSLDKEVMINMAKNPYPFDVTGHPLEEAIKIIIDKGIMIGYPDGSFKPDKALTRAELCAVLTRKGVLV